MVALSRRPSSTMSWTPFLFSFLLSFLFSWIKMSGYIPRLIAAGDKRISYSIRRTVNRAVKNQSVQVHGFVFDLDGTLTLPVLDFAELRRRLQCPNGVDILTFCHSKSGKDKEKAFHVVEEFEEEGRQNTKLQPGVCELLKFLTQCGLKRALITRNLQLSVDQLFHLLGDPDNYGGPFTHVRFFRCQTH